MRVVEFYHYDQYHVTVNRRTFMVVEGMGIMEFTGTDIPPVLTVLSKTERYDADTSPYTVWECAVADKCHLVTLSADDQRLESVTWFDAINELGERLEINGDFPVGITRDMFQQAIRAYFPRHAHLLDNGGKEPVADASVAEYMLLQQRYRIARAESARICEKIDQHIRMVHLRNRTEELVALNAGTNALMLDGLEKSIEELQKVYQLYKECGID